MTHRTRIRTEDATAPANSAEDKHAEMLAIVSELERLVAARQRSTNPRHSGRLLGNLLVARGFVHGSDLEQALAQQAHDGRRLGDIVVELGYISKHALLELLAEQVRIEVLHINRSTPEPEIARRLSERDARRLTAVPLRHVKGVIEVAVADPTRPDLVTQLTQLLLAPVCLYLTTPEIIDELINNIHHPGRSGL